MIDEQLKPVTAARVAVIADTSLQRHVLQHALSAHGYQVVLNTDPARLDPERLPHEETDLWLLDLSSDDSSAWLDALLESARAPLLFGEGGAPERHSEHYPHWERRLFGKLKRLVGDPNQAVGQTLDQLLLDAPRPSRLALPDSLAATPFQAGEPAQQVWLLAASLGGPEAVKAFLDALPGGLPLGFIYAQHIDAQFERLLPQAVGRHSLWRVNPARHGDAVRCGEVVVVPVQHELQFAADGGGMQIMANGWMEPYSPSFDQLMLNLAQSFAERCGVIVFSGMGSDGSSAAAYVRRKNAPIWTQRADSCVCSSMPDNLRDGGYSCFSGSPRELAQALVMHLDEQCAQVPA
jgi:chemosensory pili system protein ChpB (putative protein-glutamate methylesterase)